MGEDVSGLGAVELRDGGVDVGLDSQRLALAAHEAVDLVAHAHAQRLRPTQCNMQWGIDQKCNKTKGSHKNSGGYKPDD